MTTRKIRLAAWMICTAGTVLVLGACGRPANSGPALPPAQTSGTTTSAPSPTVPAVTTTTATDAPSATIVAVDCDPNNDDADVVDLNTTTQSLSPVATFSASTILCTSNGDVVLPGWIAREMFNKDFTEVALTEQQSPAQVASITGSTITVALSGGGFGATTPSDASLWFRPGTNDSYFANNQTGAIVEAPGAQPTAHPSLTPSLAPGNAETLNYWNWYFSPNGRVLITHPSQATPFAYLLNPSDTIGIAYNGGSYYPPQYSLYPASNSGAGPYIATDATPDSGNLDVTGSVARARADCLPQQFVAETQLLCSSSNNIFLVSIAGSRIASEKELLPSSQALIGSAILGPNHKTVYFVSSSSASATTVYSVPLTGGNPATVTGLPNTVSVSTIDFMVSNPP